MPFSNLLIWNLSDTRLLSFCFFSSFLIYFLSPFFVFFLSNLLNKRDHFLSVCLWAPKFRFPRFTAGLSLSRRSQFAIPNNWICRKPCRLFLTRIPEIRSGFLFPLQVLIGPWWVTETHFLTVLLQRGGDMCLSQEHLETPTRPSQAPRWRLCSIFIQLTLLDTDLWIRHLSTLMFTLQVPVLLNHRWLKMPSVSLKNSSCLHLTCDSPDLAWDCFCLTQLHGLAVILLHAQQLVYF